MMKKIIAFMQKETVLSVAWILAVLSMLVIQPNAGYIDYIDFKSLGILWSLMVVVAGLNKSGVFSYIGKALLGRVRYVWQLVLLLVLMPFFFSMLITNDVSLITFVPFSIYILKLSKRKHLVIPVVAFQTLAANLGSMLTPMGNPQNLYLYGISGMDMGSFLKLMLPYSVASLIMLLIGVFMMHGKSEEIRADFDRENELAGKKVIIFYGALFALAVLSVAFPGRISFKFVVAVVLITCLAVDRDILAGVDYTLLLTFVGFFIFTGNLGNISAVRDFMTSMVSGHETIIGILLSQCISNVPAALLLSGFTDNISGLIVGTDLGGLGTLIASMASLISFKLLAHEYNELKGRYFIYFTVSNISFLAVLMLVNAFL